MVPSPGQRILFWKQHLAPTDPGDLKRTAQLVADLDHNAFAVRERAFRELERLGPAVEPALRKALERRPGPEVRRRVEELLLRLASGRLADSRAIEVLEHIGNTEARELLRLLAEGASHLSRTQEAKGALARLRAQTAE